MIRDYSEPQLKQCRNYMSESRFQQKGATWHVTRDSLAVLQELFPQREISLRGYIECHCPPRSPDLSRLDVFNEDTLRVEYINVLHQPSLS